VTPASPDGHALSWLVPSSVPRSSSAAGALTAAIRRFHSGCPNVVGVCYPLGIRAWKGQPRKFAVGPSVMKFLLGLFT